MSYINFPLAVAGCVIRPYGARGCGISGQARPKELIALLLRISGAQALHARAIWRASEAIPWTAGIWVLGS